MGTKDWVGIHHIFALYISVLLVYITESSVSCGNFRMGFPQELPVCFGNTCNSLPLTLSAHSTPITCLPWAKLTSSAVLCSDRDISELPITEPSRLNIIHAMDAKPGHIEQSILAWTFPQKCSVFFLEYLLRYGAQLTLTHL